MNKLMLESVMKLHNDTGTSLSNHLGMAGSTFSAKINETNGAVFTQGEIASIKRRYDLSAEDVDAIFFNEKCLK